MIYSGRRKAISNHRGGKHIFTSSRRQGEAKTNRGRGCAHKNTEHPGLLQCESGNFSDEIFVSGGASCGYCSTLSPPTDVLLLLYTALISPRSTSRHAREPPAASCLCISELHE
ncbi:unnamed protein product [Pleuronectes platessa]|uniref:Uncharacterized protein n=1 Tax=Pleuronectes platessa TaxID=8262 RepID=A0A9N7TYK2_PLEPL|nr:unnamed protein product [Pleuronectes platessa]